MTGAAMTEHRLEGLEPDNLLAFLALLGLLRVLETARPDWRPRVRWDVDTPPLRPVLVLRAVADPAAVCTAAVEGLAALAPAHDFGGAKDLNHTVADARAALRDAREVGGHRADLWAALLCDAAVKVQMGKPQDQIEATPLCLLFGQGHQHFLDRLASVPRTPAPPPRGKGRKAEVVTPEQALHEALFEPWAYRDPTFSFRWDPAEDVRYALMYGDPSVAANKEGTQHGANRLAAVGLATLTVVPVERRGEVRLSVLGGRRTEDGFALCWPIWRAPLGLEAIRALLSRDDLDDTEVQVRLDLDRVLETRRISVGKFMNFTPARPVTEPAR